MQKIKMSRGTLLTFEEGCNKYLENCRQRNLRDGTINHYRQSYLYFYKFFDPKMPIEDIDEQTYKNYVLHLKKTLNNDVSINSYLRDLITTIHFFMNEGWLPHFKMQEIKVDKSHMVDGAFLEEKLKVLNLTSLLEKEFPKSIEFPEMQILFYTKSDSTAVSVTTPRLSMTVAVAVAIEEASKYLTFLLKKKM